MDRWIVEISPKPRQTTAFGRDVVGETMGKTIWMNYLSIGVDAKIVKDFENCRTNCRGLFCCQLVNKMWYGLWGFLNACYCTSISDAVTAEIDCGSGFQTLHIPDGLESIVTLNISKFGAGIDLWGTKMDGGGLNHPRCDDELLELVGVHGAPWLGMAKMSRECVDFPRMAQAKAIKYHFHRDLHMQLDGEAWLQPGSEQHPTVVHIYRDGAADMFQLDRKLHGNSTCNCN